MVPKGTYLVGPVKFDGPCENVSSLTVRMKVRHSNLNILLMFVSRQIISVYLLKFDWQGYLKASTDLLEYESGGGWVEFRWLKGLIVTGGGIFDGQGALAWPYNNCLKDSNCKILPTVCFLKTFYPLTSTYIFLTYSLIEENILSFSECEICGSERYSHPRRHINKQQVLSHGSCGVSQLQR